MKKLLLFTLVIGLATTGMAQVRVTQSEPEISTNNKSIPKKVRAALYRDYGMARNISWARKNGNYIATFYMGQRRQTATYTASGKRIYTRRVEVAMPR